MTSAKNPSEYHRTNVYLYAKDVEWLRTHLGSGWTERVREWTHEKVETIKVDFKKFKGEVVHKGYL